MDRWLFLCQEVAEIKLELTVCPFLLKVNWNQMQLLRNRSWIGMSRNQIFIYFLFFTAFDFSLSHVLSSQLVYRKAKIIGYKNRFPNAKVGIKVVGCISSTRLNLGVESLEEVGNSKGLLLTHPRSDVGVISLSSNSNLAPAHSNFGAKLVDDSSISILRIWTIIMAWGLLQVQILEQGHLAAITVR